MSVDMMSTFPWWKLNQDDDDDEDDDTEEDNTYCDWCHGKGWALADVDGIRKEIQKCDTCAIFDSDEDAKKEAVREIRLKNKENL